MHKCVCAVLVGLLFGTVQIAEARSFRVNMMPNGSINSCGNCHENSNGGGARNAFGAAIENLVTRNGQQVFWSSTLAAQDSDGDGFTNGVELGDPDGDGIATVGAQVTNPGDSNSLPQVVNNSPIFTALVDQSGSEGVLLDFQVQATDRDDDAITYTASGLPTGASFENNTFSWTPDFDQGGLNYEVSFTASDGTDSATLTVPIVVSNVNRPLTITEFSPLRGILFGSIGDTIRASVSATSPDASPLEYSWTLNGLSEIETASEFTYTVTEMDLDDVLKVSVSDGSSTLTQTWTVAKMLKGDFNTDLKVDFQDFLLLVSIFGLTESDAGFNPMMDISGNNIIDFADFLTFVQYFGIGT